ncbi:MAG: hypothetical protein GX282_06710 [Campylobacteraceae bacterium]|nr:hypothetical protein [Campylobacteraceae bacterium]
MTKRFYVFCVLVAVFLVGEIIYLGLKDYNFEGRRKFVELTGTTSFAFYVDTPYLRHQYLHGVDEIYRYHPSFRESKIGSFINTGYAKKFLHGNINSDEKTENGEGL